MNCKYVAGAVLAAALAITGCVTSETKPIPKVVAQQATVHIPEAELLDVGIKVLDPGIPENIKDNEEALAKKRIYPDLRKAEARYIPTLLRETLESTAQWGAVRVIPNNAEFVDVIVTGQLIDSNGGFLAIDVTVTDAAGRTWIKDKRYSSLVDLGAYKTSASMKARDPFQNVYSEIANDMVVARDKLTALDRENIRKVANLRFAQDLAPDAMAGMTAKDKNGVMQVVRMPADSDPTLAASRRSASATPPWSTPSTTTTRASTTPWKTRTAAGGRPASPSSRRKCARAPRRAPAPCSAPRRCSPASSRRTPAAPTTAAASPTPRATPAPWAASRPSSRA
jgi:hypothetical protein